MLSLYNLPAGDVQIKHSEHIYHWKRIKESHRAIYIYGINRKTFSSQNQ